MKSAELAVRRRSDARRRSVAARAPSGARDELAFLPAALEIVETPPSPIGRAIGATIILLFCAALPGPGGARSTSSPRRPGRSCRAAAPRSSSRSRPGWCAPSGSQDGQAVKAGDVLIELDPTMNAAERDHLRNDLLAEQLNIARLRAALAGGDDPPADFTPPAGADPALIGTQRQMLAQPGDRAPRQARRARPSAGAEGGRAGHDRGDHPQARDA